MQQLTGADVPEREAVAAIGPDTPAELATGIHAQESLLIRRKGDLLDIILPGRTTLDEGRPCDRFDLPELFAGFHIVSGHAILGVLSPPLLRRGDRLLSQQLLESGLSVIEIVLWWRALMAKLRQPPL